MENGVLANIALETGIWIERHEAVQIFREFALVYNTLYVPEHDKTKQKDTVLKNLQS